MRLLIGGEVSTQINKNPVIIMPSLLSAPFARLGEAINELERAGVNLFHYDVMDGHFVSNLAGSPGIIKSIQPYMHAQLDVHLMVDDPTRVIPWFDLDSVRSISIQVEASQDLEGDLQTIRSLDKKAGVVINPLTCLESLNPFFELVDYVLVMTVHPGEGGQKLIKKALSGITYCARRREELGCKYLIQVDGGVNQDTICSVHDAGADEIVAGSAVFDNENPADAFRNLNHLIGNR